MSDEDYYLQATNEVESDKATPALWAKALALAEGDAAKAKYKYIQLRVEQLKDAEVTSSSVPEDSIKQEVTLNNSGPVVPEKSNIDLEYKQPEEVGFIWWQVWAWLGLTIGNISVGVTLSHDMADLALILIATNSILMIMILNFNKYAFLIATILSLNPFVWIINGIYLKNRWNHPKVNENPGEVPATYEKLNAGHKRVCEKCGAKTNINYGDAYHTLCKSCD